MMTSNLKQAVFKCPKWSKTYLETKHCLSFLKINNCLVVVAVIFGLNIVTSNNFTYANALPCQKSQNVEVTNDKICLTSGCVHAAWSILENINETVDPCDDFYEFACGKFLKNTMIPDDKVSVDPMSIVEDNLQKQLRSIFDEEMEQDEIKPFTMAKTLYKSCMNEKLIEKEGLAPLHQNLKKLGGWPVLMGNDWKEDDFDWKKSVYKLHEMGYSIDYFFSFFVGIDLKNSTNYPIYLFQADLGIPREYLLEGMDEDVVMAYYMYMTDVAEILGAEQNSAAKELRESLEFNMKLANISLPREELRDIEGLYNPTTVRELNQKFPTIPWLEYFNTILSPTATVTEDKEVIVLVPSFISELEKLLEQTPKRVQANYVMWRVASSSVTCLNKEIRNKELEFNTVYNGYTEREPRWKECVNLISYYLPISVGSLYVRKYFNYDAKNATFEMVTNVLLEFRKILQAVDWMDDKTKKAALDKINSMTAQLAYPDELLNNTKLEDYYQKLEITSGNYLQSLLNISRFDTENTFEKLNGNRNKTDLTTLLEPAVVNAFYNPMGNSIILPVGILQGTFFDKDRPKYMNYGSIGYIVGHELTHALDDIGRQFDKDGDLSDWWDQDTKEKFLKKSECIIYQYGNYTSSDVSLNLNGINTQGENIADNGGVKESYLAYKEWERKNGPEPKLPGLKYTPQQMFWISMANTWCTKYRPESLKLLITTDTHSPGEFRVNGPISNMREFAEDFKCPIGSKMNPEKKCAVW